MKAKHKHMLIYAKQRAALNAPCLVKPEDLIELLTRDEWTPCSTKLPPHGKEVLFASGGETYAGRYDDGRYLKKPVGKWLHNGRIFSGEVTGWMYLPEAPK